MKKYKEIADIYPIKSINDECIIIQNKKEWVKIVIFEIIPVSLLHLTDEVKKNIETIYEEFLRRCHYSMHWIVKNQKFNVDKYLEDYHIEEKSSNNFKSRLKEIYLREMKEKLEKENIYETFFYLLIPCKIDEPISKILQIVEKLDELGCQINLLQGKIKIQQFLYENIHKLRK